MAAFTGTPVATGAYGAAAGGPISQPNPEWQVAYAKWTHTATEGAGTGEINLLVLPAGKIAIDSSKSRVKTTAFAAAADLHLGFRAYNKADVFSTAGKVVAEDDNYFADNLDAGGGALDQAFPLPTDPISHFNTEGGLKLYAMVDAGNIEAADTIEVWVVWKREA